MRLRPIRDRPAPLPRPWETRRRSKHPDRPRPYKQQPGGGDTSTPTTAPSASELDELERDVDQLTARVGSVNNSLDRLQDQQARQGLGLRGDMAGRQQSMKLNLSKAQDAVSRSDAARAKRYKEATESDLEALEKLLGR